MKTQALFHVCVLYISHRGDTVFGLIDDPCAVIRFSAFGFVDDPAPGVNIEGEEVHNV